MSVVVASAQCASAGSALALSVTRMTSSLLAACGILLALAIILKCRHVDTDL